MKSLHPQAKLQLRRLISPSKKGNSMNHSTGPRTPEGKQRTRLNALRHGLTGQTVVLPTEDLQAYKTFCDDFVVHYQPVGPVERQLVQTIADTSWRLNRISAMEHSSLSLAAAAKARPSRRRRRPGGRPSRRSFRPSARLRRTKRKNRQAVALRTAPLAPVGAFPQADQRNSGRPQAAGKRTTRQPVQKPQVAKKAAAAEFVFSTAPSASPQPLIATKNHQPAAFLAGQAPY